MRITVLVIPDCPHAALVRERIAAAVDGATVVVEWVEVPDEEQARYWGMTGSPTVLFDGVDPFATPGVPPSLSCRLYRAADGRVDGAPTVGELRRALKGRRVVGCVEGAPGSAGRT